MKNVFFHGISLRILSTSILSFSKRFYLPFIFLFTLLVIFSPGIAAEKFVGGGGDNLFSNTANWQGNSLPLAGDDIEILADCIYDLATSLAYNNLKIKNGATLSWANPSFTLNIEDLTDHGSGGILDMSNAGTLIIRGEWKASIDNLEFIAGSGTVDFLGTGSNTEIPDGFQANIAYGWGNHADAGYLTFETDPLFSSSPSNGITNTDINNWNALQGDVAAETARAIAAEAAIQADVDANEATSNTADVALQAYADQAETDATAAANAHSDAQDGLQTTALQAYADQAETDAAAAANAHSDTQDGLQTTALQAYADQAETDAAAAANNHSDNADAVQNTAISNNATSISNHITADTDLDATNELQDWSNLPGIPTDFSDGIDDVNDADSDPNNEIQSIGLSGNSLSLSNGGGTVNLPSESDPQVNSNQMNYIPFWNGSTLVDGSMYDNAGNVGIGTTTPNFNLDVNGEAHVENTLYLGSTFAGNGKLQIDNNNSVITDPIGTRLKINNTPGIQIYQGPPGVTSMYSTADIHGGMVDYTFPAVTSFTNATALHLTPPYSGNGETVDNFWALYADGDVNIQGKSVLQQLQVTTGAGSAGQVLISDTEGNASWQSLPPVPAETDPLYSVAPASGITSGYIANWNTAYSWGDHGSAGYLNTLSGAVLTTGAQTISGKKTFISDAIVDGISVGGGGNATGNAYLGYRLNFSGTGTDNTAIGYRALDENPSGSGNTAIGRATLIKNQSGYNNAAVGQNALFNNTTGQGNEAMGVNALLYNTTGNFNVAIGDHSLLYNTTGNYNVALGWGTMQSNNTGSGNTAVGPGANVAQTANNATALGGLAFVDASNKVQIGNNEITLVQLGTASNVTLETGLIQLTGGNPASGKVLTSDATGLASWQTSVDNVNDADSDPNNEIQSISLSGTSLSLSNGGGTVTISTSGGTIQGTETNTYNIRASDEGSTITGNARGEHSVDLQTSRSSNTHVAHGTHATVSGGHGNRAHGSGSTVGGGGFVIDDFGFPYEIPGNTANGDISTIGGGTANTANGDKAFIGGGKNNTTNSQWGTIVGGEGNITGGDASFVGAGFANKANGQLSSIAGGRLNQANGGFSSIPGGNELRADSYAETVIGMYNVQSGGTANSIVSTDPVFVVGNGTNTSARSNAMKILKNGKTAIGNITPTTKLDIDGQVRIRTINTNNTLNKLLVEDASGIIHSRDLASLPAPAETDPQVGVLSLNNVARWNGSSLQGGSINDDLLQVNITRETNIQGIRISKGTGGIHNMVMGYQSFISNISGSFNHADGMQSLNSNTTGSHNTAVGRNTLFKNTVGGGNMAIGSGALENNVSGNSNSAGGSSVLFNNTSGSHNVGIGINSLYKNTLGNHNVASGSHALRNNSEGDYNVASGSEALFKNTFGDHNVGIGYRAVYNNISGKHNVGIGERAIYNTSGNHNVGIGNIALFYNISGLNNVAIGYQAGFHGNLSNTITIGSQSSRTAHNQARIGNTAVSSIGGYANWTNVSDARFKNNIKEDVPGLKFILDLRPVTYNLNTAKIDKFLGVNDLNVEGEDETTRKARLAFDEKSKDAKDAIIQTGFLAQEVEASAQKLNYNFSGVDAPKNENDHYGLRYAEFVVPLVKGMQEQQEQIEDMASQISERDTRIEELEKQLELLAQKVDLILESSGEHQTTIGNGDSPWIEQNAPNPFGSDTQIKYYLPMDTEKAEVRIYNIRGKLMKNIRLENRGTSVLKISTESLMEGAYIYQLVVNDAVIDSKKMIHARN